MDLKVHFPLNDPVEQLPTLLDPPSVVQDFLSKLNQIPNRSISFFDEVICGFIILTNKDFHNLVPQLSTYGKLVESFSKLSIELSVQSSEFSKNSNPPRDRLLLTILDIPSQGSDLIYNNCISDKEFVTIWKFQLPVTYPKRKILTPKLVINVSVNVQQQYFKQQNFMVEVPKNDYSSTRNLLEGINSKTFVEDLKEDMIPFLPEFSVLQQDSDNTDQIMGPILLKAKYSLPVYPILTMRLKTAKLASQNNKNSVLLTLDLSSSSDIFKIEKLSVVVTKIEMSLKDGDVVELFDKDLLKNLVFKDKNDNINLTFKLSLRSNFDNDLKKPLNIKIVTIPKISDDKLPNLTNEIEMKWITNIDYESVSTAALKRKKPLPSRNTSTQALHNIQRRVTSIKPSFAPQQQLPTSSTLNGLRFTVFGVNKVRLGEVFHWNLQIINNSNKSCKLLILLNNDAYLNDTIFDKKFPKLPSQLPNSSNSLRKSRSTVSLNSISKDPTSMIQPQINLIRSYNAMKLKTCGIVCLDNELKTDLLEPQNILNLKFGIMAIQKGVFHLDGLKIVDLSSGENYECGKLLQVVA